MEKTLDICYLSGKKERATGSCDGVSIQSNYLFPGDPTKLISKTLLIYKPNKSNLKYKQQLTGHQSYDEKWIFPGFKSHIASISFLRDKKFLDLK